MRLAVCLLLIVPAVALGQDPGVEFFETKIRPVLAEHCYSCHSQAAKKQRGGLLLDSRDALRAGGDSGPAIVPGRPGESLLIKAVRHSSAELRMPPKGKLPDAVIGDFERWVKLGAPDPRTKVPAKSSSIDFEAARKHWAYQPLQAPVIPAVKRHGWALTPIDRFVLAKLEDKGLEPAPPADPRTLLRRLYFDLIGLPPTFEEVEDFARQVQHGAKRQAVLSTQYSVLDPAAVATVVDRLLASPRYGERWGRHWLDVARYADTKDGVLMYGDDRIRPYAYTYREYVIRAFNEDVPFDRFVHEQLAADLIAPKVEPWRLAAMGFLTLGRMFDNNIHDVLDDRIDVVTRGLLGLTVSCARCHDHKYDAVPIADYYSLYGVFANSEMPLDLPLTAPEEKLPKFAEFEKQVAPKRQEIEKMTEQQFALLSEQARQRVGDYLMRVATTAPDPLETAIFFLSLAPEDLRPQIVARWRRYLAHPDRVHDPVFGPWPELMKLEETDYSAKAIAIVERFMARPKGTERGQINPLVHHTFTQFPVTSKADVAKAYGALLKQSYEDTKKGAPTPHPEARAQLNDIVAGRESPCYFPKSQTYYYMSRAEKDRFGGLRNELDRIAVKSPIAPPRAMVLNEAAELHEPVMFIRGNPAMTGDKVPRQFLRIIEGDKRQPFGPGSGRLDLARAITADDNPLTPRVIANRVWMHHFGEPLAPNPSDFGVRSGSPSHPELLDYLAWTFREEDGWSLKKLHRRIVLSATYQQASFSPGSKNRVDSSPRERDDSTGTAPARFSEPGLNGDPENRLLSRFHRRRLDLEAMRDTLLAISGRLDLAMGGRPVDVANDPKNQRRTVYGLVDRQSLPNLFRNFDFASPDQSAERRTYTTVPQQALFGMNSPFMMEQAKALAALLEVSQGTTEERIKALYRRVLTRLPSPVEIEIGERFLRDVAMPDAERSQLTPWQQYAQVLLLTNELMFVD
jgi:hypothetical protein